MKKVVKKKAAPVTKVVMKNAFAKWKVKPRAAKVSPGQTITWKAVGAQLTILNPHKGLFGGGVQVRVIRKGKKGSLKVSPSARRGVYPYAIFCHDHTGVKSKFAKGSDPKIIII